MNNKALLGVASRIWVFTYDRQISLTGPNTTVSRFSALGMLACSQIGKVDDGTVLGFVGDENIYNPNGGNRLIGDVG